jgi:hypothetical protein
MHDHKILNSLNHQLSTENAKKHLITKKKLTLKLPNHQLLNACLKKEYWKGKEKYWREEMSKLLKNNEHDAMFSKG